MVFGIGSATAVDSTSKLAASTNKKVDASNPQNQKSFWLNVKEAFAGIPKEYVTERKYFLRFIPLWKVTREVEFNPTKQQKVLAFVVNRNFAALTAVSLSDFYASKSAYSAIGQEVSAEQAASIFNKGLNYIVENTELAKWGAAAAGLTAISAYAAVRLNQTRHPVAVVKAANS